MIEKVLTVWNQEELHYVAEEVIVQLRYRSYSFDEKGNWIYDKLTEDERREGLERQISTPGFLDFGENEALRRINFGEALYMPFSDIKESYLKDVLPKARSILRKGTLEYGCVVSDEVSDSYLDDLLALRWRENLKLWTMQWDTAKRRKGSEREEDT